MEPKILVDIAMYIDTKTWGNLWFDIVRHLLIDTQYNMNNKTISKHIQYNVLNTFIK